MKAKKYKHKKTGQIFKEAGIVPNTYYISTSEIDILPRWVVEDSYDWEEIIKPTFLFTTEDQFNISDPNQIIHPLNKSYWKKETDIPADSYLIKSRTNLLYFASLEARDRYILLNKPVFSLHEVMGYVIQNGYLQDDLERVENFPNLTNMAKKKINEAT